MRPQHFIVNLLFWIIFVIFALPSYAMQDGQATISVTILDDYTDSPVESVDVRLLQNGSELTSGVTNESGTTELQINLTSTDDERKLIPKSFQVSESYPNPFESSTNVNLSIDRRQEVQAEIFNIIGQRVASIQVLLNPGSYTLQSSLGHLAQGVYFLRIFGQTVQTVKMTKIGDRISSTGAILNIQPTVFTSPAGQSLMSNAVTNEQLTPLALIASAVPYDTAQQNIYVESDTSFTINMSRNNQVVFRVADEVSPNSDLQVPITIASGNFSMEITTPDTVTLKSGIYSVTADEGNTDAIADEIEISSEDQTVTVLTRLKTLADNQLRLDGLVTDESTGSPVNRAYIYLLNEQTSDTLAGPLFANSNGLIGEIVNLENGPNLDLSILYRKSGFSDFESTATITLPDTLTVDAALQAAPAPTAAFTVSGNLTTGAPISFDATGSSGASSEELTYSWDFGNGKKGFGQTLSYVYPFSGSYNISLTVTGDFGAGNTITESVNISNSTPAPSNTLITGEITTPSLDPIKGVTARLIGDDIESVSGTDGRIVIGDLPSGIPVVMKLTKPGYATQSVRFTPDENVSENFFTTAMIPLEQSVTIPSIENGANITGKDGARVRLPVDGLVDADGELVTGDVDLSITPLNTSSDEIFAFPGGFEGVRPDGEMGNILSYGVADYAFTRDGEPLQVMPGKRAEIEIPVYSSEVSAGDVIPLWTLDEDTGLWIEEGTGTIVTSAGSPTGLAMRAETGHFSWKNIDVYIGGTGFESPKVFTLVPRCRNTETDQFITCTIRGRSLNADGSVAGFAPTVVIPAAGNIELAVPLNKTFDIFAFSGSGNLTGSASIPPVTNTNEVINLTIDLSPKITSDEIPIAYGDFLKGKSSLSEITRYRFEGEQDDFIRIQVREAVGFEGLGDVFLLNSDEDVLQQGNYANNFSRYLFEDLPETGTYFIDVVANTNISNFDIGLELFDGPVNRDISYGDRIFDFLWPGTVNTYTFQGETEDVLEIIAQNFPTGESWSANLTIKTPNPLVDYNSSFFDYNAWVKRLEEKDGTYSLEVSGFNSQSHGQYFIDVDTLDNFVDEANEIAYGDSVLSPVYEIDQINEYTFSGNAGDLIRLHVDKPYPRETSNRLFPELKLYSPSELLLDDNTASFSADRDAGIGYILPADGIYRVEIIGNANSLSTEGEVFSLLLRKIENPLTVNLDDEPNGSVLRNQFFANELDINRYTFSKTAEQFVRLSVRSASTRRPDGKLLIFDNNNQFIADDTFISNNRKRGITDSKLTDGEITGIVVSSKRDDVHQSSNETFDIQLKKAQTITYNTTTTEQFPPNTIQYFHIANSEAGKEVAVGAVGTYSRNNGPSLEGPQGNSISFDFARSQTFLPALLEEEGDYLLQFYSSSAANFDLTVVELEPAETFNLVPDDVVSLSGAIRLSGDIDRFDFTPDTDGTIIITLNPVDENSIDDTEQLRVQVRDPDTNGLVRARNITHDPDGEEFFIWEGNISGLSDYRIYVYDADAINTGEFELKVEFTTNP